MARGTPRSVTRLARSGPGGEAAGYYEQLLKNNRSEYLGDFADCLNNLSVWLWWLKRPGEAIPYNLRAIKCFDQLVTTNPGKYEPRRALARLNLGAQLSDLGLSPAVRPTSDALRTLNYLAKTNPGLHQPNIGLALNNLSGFFCQLNRPHEAVPLAQQAVEVNGRLAAQFPAKYRARHVAALTNLAAALYATGNRPAPPRSRLRRPRSAGCGEGGRRIAARQPDRRKVKCHRGHEGI